jgi:hypothetical protein
MSEIHNRRKLASWNIDKYAFIFFIASSLAAYLYFSYVSKQWEKPIFKDVALQLNAPKILLNYSEEEDLLILQNGNEQPIKISCNTVEADLCGRGKPYAFNYEVEYINLVQVQQVNYIDRVTYVSDQVNVIDLTTNIRYVAEQKMSEYSKKQTFYVSVIGILFLLYVAIRFFGFGSKKK